ncbi:aldehyde dehydrogenase family protein [Antrihabitans cavernicola]|uniref:Aldehyde dehydrogenase n=1 Tax=Antrihabitans cavernicola TaxID=2495913 RepID=A0A5A7S479_9NOCA|nr:aldehyde dehydrogenase [Spelaeibacter cavernicola]KAA0017030.1 aldehyde dehydrogenase [Spelaeibacter cavernicola]
MHEYPLFINGRDVDGDGWTYVVRASELIRDTVGAFNLKRGLELDLHSDAVPGSVAAGIYPDSVAARCAWGGRELCRTALDAAHGASVEYSRIPLDDRIGMLGLVHKALVANVETLVDMLVIEGHPRRLAEWELSGVIRGCDEGTLSWYRNQFDSMHAAPDDAVQLVRKPDGVVCVNPPQNAAGSNGALGAMALMAGNAVVVKAPRSTPLTVMYFYRDIVQPALESIGAPPGTLNIVSGDSQQIMRDWIASPYVDDVLFFGGSDVGLKVGYDCVAAGKKPILELSGNDGFVVWEDADLPAAAQALSECFYGSAQICMVPKYAIVHPRVADAFIQELLAITETVVPGYPEDPHALLSPVLKADQFYDYLAEAHEHGADVLCGGHRIGVDGTRQDTGLFFEPTVLRIKGLDRGRAMSCVTEETFFPMLPIVIADDVAESELLGATIGFLNQNVYGLRNSVWTSSRDIADRFAKDVNNGGQLKINDSHIGFRSRLATHGGTGRTGGPFGELNYVALRTSHLQGIVWGTGDVRAVDELVERR